MCNHLLLNADKFEVVMFRTVNQLRSATEIKAVSVAEELLPVTSEIKSLSVIADQRLAFDAYANPVVKACTYKRRRSGTFEIGRAHV